MKTVLPRIFLFSIIGWFILSLSAIASAKELPEKPIVYFGLIPLYTPHLMYEKFQPLMDYLSSNTPYRFKMRLAKDYNEIISLLKGGSINIALIGGVSYIAARDKVDLVPILKPVNPQGKPFYRSIIVVRKDSNITSLPDLKGKAFAFGSRWSTAAAVVPLYHLYNSGIRLSDLKTYFHLRYSDSVVREVLKGNYDVGAVIDTTAYFYKDKGLKFIFVSEPIPTLPIVVRKDASEELVDAVKKAILGINPENPAHRDMLKEWGEEIRYGFVEAKDSDYEGIGRMVEYLKEKGVYFRVDEN
ncbi:MAG: phosphate/phosphite/phosphonate ABC transporter substrate-binding protein [Deltaproteobacteria bacterium]|nr:phosphate/phosphite/phosphonate ABC transporter substrate-binding protein [Deltaproteobacteria bacterium]